MISRNAKNAMPATEETAAAFPDGNVHAARYLAVAAYALLNTLYLIACVQRTAIPGAFFDELQRDLGLRASQVTRLSSVFLYCYASLQVFAGMLIDRFGGKRTGAAGGTLLGAGLVLFSTAHSAGMLYLARVVAAIGQTFLYLCVIRISRDLFPPRRFGALVGIATAIGFLGSALGTMPAQRLSQAVGWRALFVAVGCTSLLSSAALALALPGLRERGGAHRAVSWGAFRSLFNERGRFCFITHQFFSYPAYFILQAVLGQKFIQDYLGRPAPEAATFTLLLTLGSALFTVVSAPLMGRMGNRRKPLAYIGNGILVLIPAAMMLGIRFSAPPPFFLGCFFLVAAAELNAVPFASLLAEITDPRTIAFTAAIRNSFPFLGAGIVGAVCGRILDAHAPAGAAPGAAAFPPEAYLWILFVMIAFALIGLAMTAFIPETRGQVIWNGDRERCVRGNHDCQLR